MPTDVTRNAWLAFIGLIWGWRDAVSLVACVSAVAGTESASALGTIGLDLEGALAGYAAAQMACVPVVTIAIDLATGGPLLTDSTVGVEVPIKAGRAFKATGTGDECRQGDRTRVTARCIPITLALVNTVVEAHAAGGEKFGVARVQLCNAALIGVTGF